MTHLHGIAFGGYRSFPSDPLTRLSHLQKVNLIAGQNNAGKSNVLRIVHGMFSQADGKDDVETTGAWDRPAHESVHKLQFEIGFAKDEIREAVQDEFKNYGTYLTKFLNETQSPDDLLWFNYKVEKMGIRAQPLSRDPAWLERLFSQTSQAGLHAVQVLYRNHFQTTGGDQYSALLMLMERIARSVNLPRNARTVSGTRSITSDESKQSALTGTNIKRTLLQLQNPSSFQLNDRQTFIAVQRFVQNVLDDPDLTIDIPHDLSTIHITQAGTTLPIENYGTGVHQVVILGAAATVISQSVVCIEEPEVHLHPLLQRKLLRYLQRETSNQYFIATHSAHLLDSALGAIFHVRREDQKSSIHYAGSASDKVQVCADLGYRPSDLVQSNAVIWVEGPSDRVYIKSWLEARAPKQFIEGIHYSIMFYGGRLLNSLTAEDPVDVDDFISLRRLNRYMAVVIDSDRTSRSTRINATKQRIKAELEHDPETGFAWVTSGYTIENYVPWESLRKAIASVHPNAKPNFEPGRFDNPLRDGDHGVRKFNKMAIARHVTAQAPSSWPFRLDSQVDRLVALIREANRNT